jgi:glycine dehydrogenase subunit 1
MGSYVPNTRDEQLEMLGTLGMEDFDALFAHIPAKVKLNRPSTSAADAAKAMCCP